jgi:hypothetical protein
VHEILFSEQFVFGFAVVGVVYAAIYGANCSTLRFVVEANTFGAFFVRDVVNVHVYWFKGVVCLYFFAV